MKDPKCAGDYLKTNLNVVLTVEYRATLDGALTETVISVGYEIDFTRFRFRLESA